MLYKTRFVDNKAFTLIELLVVVACYQTPCPSHGGSTRNETNKLYAEVELY